MTSKFITLIILLLSFSVNAKTTPIWGKTGHRVVGAIAEKHLDENAKKRIQELLDHQSLALVSTFADEIKFDARYDKFKTWHYLNMKLDETYETSAKNPEGDIVTGIEYCKNVISDASSSNEDKIFYLKLLIHLIGDLHQPMHLGLKEDRGGNDFKVKWNYRDSNMHKVWDSQMIESYGMSYSELVDNSKFLTLNEVYEIQKGEVLDWIAETHKLTVKVYNDAKAGDNLRSAYSFKYLNIARFQMQKGGLRLAKILNELFGGNTGD